MPDLWRWVGPTIILASVLAAFMALDRTTLHWYVPSPSQSTVSSAVLTPAADASVTVTPTAIPQFGEFEVQALALQYVAQYFQAPGGYDCGKSELSAARSRWTVVCTARAEDGPMPVVIIAVDAVTGFAADLRSYDQYLDITATAIAHATATASAAQTAAAGRTPQR